MSRLAVIRSTLGFLAALTLELALAPAGGDGRAAQETRPAR
jgi:hypothetical protein